jgi:Ni/Co efflux regulator RcnB
MKKRLMVLLAVTAAALVFVAAGVARAGAPQYDKSNMKFTQADKDAIKAYWDGHKDKPCRGLRAEDKLPAGMDAQVKPGFVMTDSWRKQTHLYILPPDFGFKLQRPPIGWVVYAFGEHYVILVQHSTMTIDDVVRVN